MILYVQLGRCASQKSSMYATTRRYFVLKLAITARIVLQNTYGLIFRPKGKTVHSYNFPPKEKAQVLLICLIYWNVMETTFQIQRYHVIVLLIS